ncbi:MAG: hypothetical protein IKV20_00105 [Clostridia bacterium]|nr:hypothetical protein [Clostridia bacterium]
MLKGTEKRVVRIKGVGGDVFEEAYFVLKDGRVDTPEEDFISEVSRIIEENSLIGKEEGISPKTGGQILLLSLAVGVALLCATVIGLLIF